MKHQTAKPSEQVMRFFTPDLYVRFNSADEEEADRANDEWENAIQQYRKHLVTIRDQLPSQVRKITELSLHDSELRAMDEELEPFFSPSIWPVWSAVAILSVKLDDRILSLIYFLFDRIRKHSPHGWPFSTDRPHWLYDEIDVVPNHGFMHRVLLSDGTIIEIPFASAIIHTLLLRGADENTAARQSA